MASLNSSPAATRVVKTFCQFCPWDCGINVYVTEGKIVKVEGTPENPYSQGVTCVKAEQVIDYEYSPERLKYPLRKKNGEWQRISWDEALDTIAAKLTEIKEKYGAGGLSVFAGDPMLCRRRSGQDLLWRFCDLYGTTSRLGVDIFCSGSQARAHQITFGRGKRLFPQPENAKSIIVWGMNPTHSFPPMAKRILDGIEKGAKLIVIDPRRTDFAKKADLHIQPRPGTDTALAMGMLYTIINEELYDKEFVAKWTVGFDKLAEHVKRYPPEEVEKITGVPAETIRKAARIHATNRPGCVAQSVGTLDKHASGFQTTRAICILHSLTGNVDAMGGEARTSIVPLNAVSLREKREDLKMLGAEEYPLFYELWGERADYAQTTNWADMVLSGQPYPIKAMMAFATNPALTFPNSKKFQEAVQKLDLLVVIDIFMTETGEMADIVLPAATFLERYDLRFYNGCGIPVPYIILGKPAVEPSGECWNDVKFIIELAKRMGYGEYFPWENEKELIDYVLEPSGLSVKYLTEEKPEGITFGQMAYKEYETSGFATPSGKIELFSETLENLGYDPLPTHQEAPESLTNTPDLAKEYPLILTTAVRISEYWHSGQRNLPKLRQRMPEPIAEIHPDSAAKYGISDGDMMVVETKRGSIEIKARVTEDIAPQMISIPQGWKQANVNILTDETPAAPETGYPSLGAMLCKVSKKA